MGEDKKYWFNEYGSREWSNKFVPEVIAVRSYYWVDRVLFLNGRTYMGEESYTKFKENVKRCWTAIEPPKE